MLSDPEIQCTLWQTKVQINGGRSNNRCIMLATHIDQVQLWLLTWTFEYPPPKKKSDVANKKEHSLYSETFQTCVSITMVDVLSMLAAASVHVATLSAAVILATMGMVPSVCHSVRTRMEDVMKMLSVLSQKRYVMMYDKDELLVCA